MSIMAATCECDLGHVHHTGREGDEACKNPVQVIVTQVSAEDGTPIHEQMSWCWECLIEERKEQTFENPIELVEELEAKEDLSA